MGFRLDRALGLGLAAFCLAAGTAAARTVETLDFTAPSQVTAKTYCETGYSSSCIAIYDSKVAGYTVTNSRAPDRVRSANEYLRYNYGIDGDVVLRRNSGVPFKIIDFVADYRVSSDLSWGGRVRLTGTTPDGWSVSESYFIDVYEADPVTYDYDYVGPQHLPASAFAGIPLRSLAIDTLTTTWATAWLTSLTVQTPLPAAGPLLLAAAFGLHRLRRRAARRPR